MSYTAAETLQSMASSYPKRQCRGDWTFLPNWTASPLRRNLSETWHASGMNRIRLSTTVDAGLLSSARDVRAGITDAALIDEALGALLARHRSAEVDASYAAYDKHPVDEPDEWGDLASWRRVAADS